MRVFYWIPAIATSALIFALSHQSHPPDVEASEFVAFGAHFIAYFVLGMSLIWGATRGDIRSLGRKAAWGVVLAAALYGLSDEFHQSFIPGRHPDPLDCLVDVLGAFSAVAAVRLSRRRAQGR